MMRTKTLRRATLALCLVGGACSGQVGDGGQATGGTSGSAGAAGAKGLGGEPVIPLDADVGRVGPHRLNNLEYDNTIRDLLGVTSSARATFISDEKSDFDNNADALAINDARYEQYYDAAAAIAAQAFADPVAKAKILTCTQAETAPADGACTRDIIAKFGRRAWRRPLEAAEVDRLVKVAADARASTATFQESIQQLVTVMLAVPQFLYRMEFDPDPTSGAKHPVGNYELATRLSYLAWSSMPDERLFSLAASGDIQKPEVLDAEVDRLLADPKSTFTETFAGQWLGIRSFLAHQVEKTAFPEWDEPLRQAMAKEGLAYFDEFLKTDRTLDDFFTADFNFVNARLARHYGMANVTGDALMRISDTGDARRGFLGLGAFLTNSSFSYRTAPTLRGQWVLHNLMCETIEKPNRPDIPKIDSDNPADPNAQNLNVAMRLAAHRDNPDCSGCHAVLDPIGLGLETFDAIGRYRTAYPNGDAVVSSGELPGGKKFSGLNELAGIVAQDPHFGDCATQKLFMFSLGRSIVPADQPFLDQIHWRFQSGGGNVRALLKAVVRSDTFRFRRGEPVDLRASM
jgi:hypothetical protein